MFQVIDLRPTFGRDLLAFFVAKERNELFKEQQKIRKGELALAQEEKEAEAQAGLQEFLALATSQMQSQQAQGALQQVGQAAGNAAAPTRDFRAAQLQAGAAIEPELVARQQTQQITLGQKFIEQVRSVSPRTAPIAELVVRGNLAGLDASNIKQIADEAGEDIKPSVVDKLDRDFKQLQIDDKRRVLAEAGTRREQLAEARAAFPELLANLPDEVAIEVLKETKKIALQRDAKVEDSHLDLTIALAKQRRGGLLGDEGPAFTPDEAVRRSELVHDALGKPVPETGLSDVDRTKVDIAFEAQQVGLGVDVKEFINRQDEVMQAIVENFATEGLSPQEALQLFIDDFIEESGANTDQTKKIRKNLSAFQSRE